MGNKFLVIILLSACTTVTNAQQWDPVTGGINYNSGNVGIGTSSPKSYLDVGYAVINKLNTVFARLPEGNSTGDGTFLGVRALNTQPIYCNSFSIEHRYFNNLNSAINFYRGGSTVGGFITFATNDGTEKMRIDANGNIGIGTINPSTLLHVVNPIALGQITGNIAEIARFSGSTTNNSQLRIQLKRNSNGTDWYTASTRLQCVTDVTNQGYFEFNPQGAGSAAAIGVGGSEIIRFNSNGNVLIGRETQNNTSFKLDINGPAHATKVVVNSDGADFVFDSSYTLRPLNEVENFIQQNHHLPEIAPAADMQTNGVDLGDNQTKLLQKIEELTLYLIEQNKQLITQNKKIQQLTADNNQLKQQLSQIEEMKTLMAHQQAAIEQLQNESKQIQTNHK